MAGAEAHKKLELQPLEVPSRLVKGSKFIKWPKSDGDDTIVAVPVTLKLDPKGHILYWQEPNRDTESLEVSCVRDTRIEKYAKIPKSERWEKALQNADPQIREVAGNLSIPLESKCLTIVYGMKFHEPCFLNFIAVEENPNELIKIWADFLLELAYHPLTWHMSVQKSFEKIHTKLVYETNQFGKIPVRKCMKMLGGNQKRTESALLSVGLMSKGKRDEMIDPDEFEFIAFQKVLQLTCQRPELDQVFTDLGAKRMSLSKENFKRFINNEQRDSRLNEVIYPSLNDDQVENLIMKYEPNIMLTQRSQLSLEGLEAYLQSDDNLCVSTLRYGLYQDMTEPISHYFINSSHNTYLTGNQYKSSSKAEIYRQCLLAGCRCVELDCWEGKTGQSDEPVITHGFTLCSEVSFKEVIEAINESAFKTSQYPVILSFENHVDNPQQQGKMADYCRDIFGDKLLIDPLESHQLTPGTPLPSPKDLMGKIIVKNKKQKPPQERRYMYKRGSIPSETSAFSPSSVGSNSPSASPSFFPPRSASTSSGKAVVPNVGRKRSEPVVGTQAQSPLVMSPSLPIGNALPMRNGTYEQNGPLFGDRSPVNGKANGKPKRPKGRLISAKSFEEETIQEQRKEERACEQEAIASNSNSQTNALNHLRKSSCPATPTRESNIRKEQRKEERACEQEAIASNSNSQTNALNHLHKSSCPATPTREKIKESEEESDSEKPQEDGDEEGSKDDSTSEDAESKDKVEEEEEDDDDEGGQISYREFDENSKESGTAARESRAYEAMSSLVNYVEPVRFKSFEISDKRNRSYEISSFTESAALRLITYYPIEMVNYNKRQLSRIYPKGARVDSSNYNPQLYWNAGCQLVALNFQTLDPNMQFNLGLFEFNNNCGYLLKPEHMRRKDRRFDPFIQNIIDGVVAATLTIEIISGQFVSSSKVSTYVEVDMYGLVADMIKKKYKTATVNNNGTNPYYKSEPFEFKRIVLPSLAILRVGVMDTNGNCLGQRFLPVDAIRPGYRYITLRNDGNQPLTMPSLFVRIKVKDYVPEPLEKYADMLANPLDFADKQEKEAREINERKRALKILLDSDEKKKLGVEDDDKEGNDKVVIKQGMPDKISLRSPSDGVTVYGGESENEEDASSPTGPQPSVPTPQPRRTGIDQLKPFEPESLEEMKKYEKYKKIQKSYDRKSQEVDIRHRKEYDKIYKIYFDQRRPVRFGIRSSAASQTKHMNLPFEINTALPPEAKKEHLLRLLRQHIVEEKRERQNFIEVFMKDFEKFVKKRQQLELVKLKKISETEKAEVQERKDLEKDEKLSNLMKTCKEEFDRRKQTIIETHISECVQERKMLEELQKQRLEKVMNEQQEILMGLSMEERNRLETIKRNCAEQNVDQIFDIRQAEWHLSHGNSTMTINSVAYPVHDGKNESDYVTKL